MKTKARILVALLVTFGLAGPAVAVTAGYIQSWHVQVTTTAALVKPPTGAVPLAMECMAPEAGETGASTLIAAGGPDVNPAPGASRNGAVFCGSGCARTSAKAGSTGFYLRSASTVEISCWAVTDRP